MVKSFGGMQTVILFAALAALASAPLRAEAPAYSLSEYKAYMKVHDAMDPAEKEALIFDFLDYNAQSSLTANVLYELQAYLDTLFKEGRLDQAAVAAKRALDYHPVARDLAERAMARLCFVRGDWPGFVTYSEMIYKRVPTPRLAAEIAVAAFKSGDTARFERFTAIVGEKGDTREKADLHFTVFQEHVKAEAAEKALAEARVLVGVLDLPEKPADFSGDWNVYQLDVLNPALGTVGMAHYKAGEWAQAIEVLQKIVKRNPRDASTYYYLGTAYLKQDSLRLAAENYACAAVLSAGPVSEKSAEMIRKIITATESDERAYDAYLQKAKEKLGLG
ncbi:MAG: tetratricopeptide repeat protein [Acidobacteria bacterium]|nr:tetratricopeptide repeat protein [Acidobacteriota bacterium]